jgi:hypothetical protein
MSSAKAATEWLSGFRKNLVGVPDGDAPGGGDPLERLGKILAQAGNSGMAVAQALQASGLSRDQFYSALGVATKLNLIESFEDQGTNKLRLTPSAMSLY